jgi:hypothetical protein
VFRSGARTLLALSVVGLAALLPQAGGLATPDLYPGAENVDNGKIGATCYN